MPKVYVDTEILSREELEKLLLDKEKELTKLRKKFEILDKGCEEIYNGLADEKKSDHELILFAMGTIRNLNNKCLSVDKED